MRTVFSRLLLTYIIIILAILLLSGFLITQIYSSDYISERYEELVREGTRIGELTNQRVYGLLPGSYYNGAMYAISSQYGCVIWLTNMSGTKASVFYGIGSNGQGYSLNQDIDVSVMGGAFENILRGQSVYLEGNFDSVFNGSTLTVGCPLEINNTIEGAVLLHTSLAELNSSVIRIYQRVGITVAICGALALVLVYVMARRISGPLVQLSTAVKEYAKGDFNRTVTIKSRDEIGELTRSINEMSEDLKRLEGMRREFVSNAAHEIRTPLTGIRGYVEAMLDGAVPEAQKEEYLGRVRSEVLRLSSLVNGLLDLSQLDSDVWAPKIAPMELNESIRRVLITFEPSITQKHIQMQVDLSEAKIHISADAQRIEQVLGNILHNAIKFTPESGHIAVTSGVSRKWVYFTVRDDGAGIPEEKQRHIFERFYQAENAHTPGSGVGLGLSIAQRIVQRHGGEIRIWSKEGKGTRVLVALPAKARSQYDSGSNEDQNPDART